jgi:hypothetical protein
LIPVFAINAFTMALMIFDKGVTTAGVIEFYPPAQLCLWLYLCDPDNLVVKQGAKSLFRLVCRPAASQNTQLSFGRFYAKQ